MLRRTGRTVYDGAVEQSRFAGWVVVDERKMQPEDVVTLAQEILDREVERNNTLRAEHGLPPLPRQQLRGDRE